MEFEMFPLSFEEYLQMKKFYKKTVSENTTIELNNYIIEGGFPRTIFFDNLNQWFYNMPSAEVVEKVPVDFLMKAYFGLHDLELDLAVKKVGEV